MRGGMDDRGVIGRFDERRRIREAIDDGRERAVVALIVGEAGMGKTTLWHEARNRAADEIRVMSTRASETESVFAFAGLTDLLRDVDDQFIDRVLPKPQRDGLLKALLRSETSAPPGDEVVSLAVLNVLRALSASEPLVLAVDDVQWLDAPTASVFAYVIRRLDTERVAVIVTERTGEVVPEAVRHALADRTDVTIRLGAMASEDIAAIVRSGLPDGQRAEEVVRLAAGNPLFAAELASSLGGASEPDRGRVFIPTTLRGVLAAGLEHLSAGAVSATVAAYALARPTVATVSEGIRALGHGPAGLDDALSARALLRRGSSVRLRHPLIGSLLYENLTPDRRRRLHAVLAELPIDAEERARHLARSVNGHDPAVAAELESVASRARSRGAVHAAAELMSWAVDLTPPALEDERLRRLFTTAVDEFRSGAGERARGRWRGIADRAGPGPVRARALWHMSNFVGAASVDEIDQNLRSALDECGGDDELRATVLSSLARNAWWAGRLTDGLDYAERAHALAAEMDDPALHCRVLSYLAMLSLQLGLDRWEEHFEGSLELERLWKEILPIEIMPTAFRPNITLAVGEDFVQYRDECLAAKHFVEQRGGAELLGHIMTTLCEAELEIGNVAAAAAHVAEAVAAVERGEALRLAGQLLLTRARMAFYSDRLEAARELMIEGLRADEEGGYSILIARDRHLLGMIDLTLGRFDDVVGWLRPAYRRLREGGWAQPGNYRFVPDLIEALVHIGRLEEARSLSAECRADAVRLDRVVALAALRRSHALILAAEGSLDEAVAEAQASVDTFQHVQQPFNLARGLLVLGQLQRRCRLLEDSERTLYLARAEFQRLGLVRWAARAIVRLRVTTLGGFAVEEAGGHIEIPVGKPAQLVKLLACSGGRLLAEQVIDILWPEATEAAGRKGLRNALGRLRTAVPDLVERADDAVVFGLNVQCDLDDFDRRIDEVFTTDDVDQRMAAARAALDLHRGELLPEDVFEDWAVAPRERVRARYLDMIDWLAGAVADAGDAPEAIRLLESGVAVDPLNERRYFEAAELLELTGDRVRATSMRRRGESVLEELGLSPPDE